MKGAHPKERGEREKSEKSSTKKIRKNLVGKKQRRAIHIYPASEVHFSSGGGNGWGGAKEAEKGAGAHPSILWSLLSARAHVQSRQRVREQRGSVGNTGKFHKQSVSQLLV